MLDDAGNGSLYLRDLEFKRQRLVLRRHGGPHARRDPHQRAGRGAAGQERAERLRLARQRPARVLPERQVRRRLEAHRERRHARGADRGPVQQLPRQVARTRCSGASIPTTTTRRSATTASSRRWRRRSASSTSRRARARTTAMWGNFKVGYVGNELAHVDRGLYGANAHYASDDDDRLRRAARWRSTGSRPSRARWPSYEEFRGTGGSLYYLHHQDVLGGSERVRIELRDKDLGHRQRRGQPAAGHGLRHRLPPGSRAAHRAAVVDRERQPARAQQRREWRRGLPGRALRVHAGLRRARRSRGRRAGTLLVQRPREARPDGQHQRRGRHRQQPQRGGPDRCG